MRWAFGARTITVYFLTTFPDIKPNIPSQSTFIQGPGLIRAESDCIAYVISLCSCINLLKALGAADSRGRCSPRLLHTYLSGVWVHVSFLSALRLSQYWFLSATEKLVLYPDVSFKGIVRPNLLKMYSSSSIQHVDELVQILLNLALHHLLTDGSSAVNGCRQNKNPNSW